MRVDLNLRNVPATIDGPPAVPAPLKASWPILPSISSTTMIAILAAFVAWRTGKPDPLPIPIPGGHSIPAGITITDGPGYFHLDWPVVSPAPAPVPIPVPTPTPAPTPAPIVKPLPILSTGILHATLVVDLADPAPGQAQMIRAFTGGALASLSVVPRVYGSDAPELAAYGLAADVGALPCLIYQDQLPGAKTAPVLAPPTSPKSIADVINEAKRLKGIR